VSTGTGIPLTAPAAERNKGPILAVLKRVLQASGLVLEIASGTGQHVVHFAQSMPHLTWQPSDPDPELRTSIRAWIAQTGLSNVRAPLELDVQNQPWPIVAANAVVCINMIHIAPWSAATALMAGAARLLPTTGVLVLYGPYRREERHTAPSNEAFDRQLRASNPDWGVRDLEAVTEAAASHGLALQDVTTMPANNLCVVFRPATCAP
jgi:cyclopropane fatty-acyl-phospholipid synthase-like methyltransferase